MHVKKHIGFSGFRDTMAHRFEQIEDNRAADKVDHSIHDCLMSAFAMMFFQDPSFILVAKPKDHKILFEWVSELTQLGAGHKLEYTDTKGRQQCYQWVNDVPLNGTKC